MSPRDSSPTITAILNAADSLLETGGRDAVTLRAVGEVAGVSRMTPYRHFEDKSALLQALAERTLRAMAEGIRVASASASTPAEKLRAGARAYLDHALDNPHHYQLIFGDTPLAQPGPELNAAADDAMRAVEEIVADAQGAGLLRSAPTRELATVLWVLLHGLAALQITGHLHEPRTVDGDTQLEVLLDLALAQFHP
ncbi:TetR/AcrR family transcriptional regulator [Arachnia propionica]|uniref:TetR/AcrR family transcriptional regulator n=1 Tax=Arachnia propionica TaxID=1750 RepID=A0A3P1T2I7_9ACTN|nr:TetR/AcrR family transcriptional regulator [Arachnia propionica]RRD03727.1 TetR/AcrR family transcriptional regulator [Arachnia propionica]